MVLVLLLFSVADIAKLEDELKELQIAIEKAKENHQDLIKQKEKLYIETEEELIANNHAISL